MRPLSADKNGSPESGIVLVLFSAKHHHIAVFTRTGSRTWTNAFIDLMDLMWAVVMQQNKREKRAQAHSRSRYYQGIRHRVLYCITYPLKKKLNLTSRRVNCVLIAAAVAIVVGAAATVATKTQFTPRAVEFHFLFFTVQHFGQLQATWERCAVWRVTPQDDQIQNLWRNGVGKPFNL